MIHYPLELTFYYAFPQYLRYLCSGRNSICYCLHAQNGGTGSRYISICMLSAEHILFRSKTEATKDVMQIINDNWSDEDKWAPLHQWQFVAAPNFIIEFFRMVNHKNEVIDSVWMTFIASWKALQADVVQNVYFFRTFNIFRDKTNWIVNTDCFGDLSDWMEKWIRIQSLSCLIIKAIVISRTNMANANTAENNKVDSAVNALSMETAETHFHYYCIIVVVVR